MPYKVEIDNQNCPASKPWAVKNTLTGTVNGRCHPTKAKARDQQQALYVALRKEGKLSEYFLAPVERLFSGNPLTATDNVRWVQAFPYDSWDHPIYGTTTMDKKTAEQYVKNFKENVRGQDLAINYDHGEDKAKGNKAAGWIKDMEARDNGLFIKVEFTPTAVQELINGEWKYFSSESFDTWTNPNTNATYQYVMSGGALTNKPWVKGMLPINFSEVMTEKDLEEVEKQFAVWSAAYVNTLPDSSFLFIQNGGKKDSEGKTEPRILRHLPYKDDKGKIDLAHLRNAIARIPQMVGVDQATKDRLQAKARALLSAANKGMSEAVIDSLVDVFDESKEWEHSDPGVSSPPPPRQDEDGSDDLDKREGWRRETPPDQNNQMALFGESEAVKALRTAISDLSQYVSTEPDPADKAKCMAWIAEAKALLKKDIGELGYADVTSKLRSVPYVPRVTQSTGGGSLMAELTEGDVRELRVMFEVDDDKKIVEAAKLKFGELSELRRAVSTADQQREFADKYPDLWTEHNKLMERDRSNAAKNFSESVAKVRKAEGYGLKETSQGLSAKALDTVAETHKKFSEGTGTIADFEECVKTIVNGGLVKYGEIGSSQEGDELPAVDTNSANGVAHARKIFSEVVAKIQKDNPDMPYMEAITEAGKKYPDLATAYRISLPA